MPNPRAFLIDGTAFCYRAFYAVAPLTTADGRPTNAVFGFAAMLQALQEKQRPDHLAVAFDVGKPTFRHEQFEAYKAQRKPMPEGLIGQLPLIKRLLQARRIPVFEQEGFEAEDVLATLADQLAAQGVDVFIVTGDKDALQLVNSRIKVYNPHKKAETVLDAAAVKARYGVQPEQMVDLMALMGDDTDNIPSVPGIGEKTASRLVQQFGTIDALYQRLDEVDSEASRKSLAEAREQVALCRKLAQISHNVPVTTSPQILQVQEPDWAALKQLYRKLGFKRQLQTLEAEIHTPASDTQAALSLRQVDSEAAVPAFEKRLREASSPAALWQEPSALVLAFGPKEAWACSWAQAPASAQEALKAWLANPQAPKIGYDTKRLRRQLQTQGIALAGVVGDVLLAAHLINPARTRQTLVDVVDEHLQESLPPIPPAEEALFETALAPAAQWACAIWRVHEKLLPRLTEQGLFSLYMQLELPLAAVLADMETAGIALDTAHLAGLRASMGARLEALTTKLHQLAGHAFNVNSPKQLGQVLFEELKLPVIKRTKTGPSTDIDVLQQLAKRHALPAGLIEYRELSKLVSTYVEALPQMADAQGRVHTTFHQTGTATGRLSSSEPNLQNIPIRTELGRHIRRAFVAGGPDHALVAADYSQVELRILAHVSGDEQLIEAFRQGRDIHRATASLIYGLPETEVQPEQRSAMKAVNFGILYGMSAHGLSRELNLPLEEAQAFIDAYFQRYPKVRQYLDAQIAQARSTGFVQTLLGRRRYIPEALSSDMMTRQFGERMAINAPIQGTAADLIKKAMVELHRVLSQEGWRSRMVLQVHDELVFDAPKEECARLAALVRRVMEGALTLCVPLTVTIKTGLNWLDLAPVSGSSAIG